MAYAIGIIHEENGVFGISFPDFPGAISTGATLDEVVAKGAQALAFHVDGMVEDGEAIPALRSLDGIRTSEPDWMAGGLAVAVPVELPGKSVRINISVEERALERIDRAASAEGKTRSGFLVEAALVRARAAAAPAGTGAFAQQLAATLPVALPGTIDTLFAAELRAGEKMVAAMKGVAPAAKPKRKA